MDLKNLDQEQKEVLMRGFESKILTRICGLTVDETTEQYGIKTNEKLNSLYN